MRELILGGQKSGKSVAAESRARAWLEASPAHRAVLVATGLAHDEEMRQRIARHQADRAARLPALRCVEEPVQIAQKLQALSDAQTLVIVDCLTMWLTNLLMPAHHSAKNTSKSAFLEEKGLLPGTKSSVFAIELIASMPSVLSSCKGPVVLVSNEIGLGVIPLGHEVRQFVDELGKLNQALAHACERVTFMAAGCALTIKGQVV
jgi:adenosylcobinamide kinase / adenosylcobinamide-phosphate guanylyltransferase